MVCYEGGRLNQTSYFVRGEIEPQSKLIVGSLLLPKLWFAFIRGYYLGGEIEPLPNHRHQSLKTFEEHIQTAVSCCFVT